jgi:hypothetical protein
MKSIKRVSVVILLGIFVVLGLACGTKQDNPRALVEKMVAEVGGIDKLYSLRDVEYTYSYQDLTSGKKDVSLERYIFDGELSWAKYEAREKNVAPQLEGETFRATTAKSLG